MTYNTGLRSFENFRKLYYLSEVWPIPSEHIILFMTFCFEKGFSPKTITTYIASLNYYHKLHRYYDINRVFIVSKLLEGCRRNRVVRDKRAPVTKSILTAICQVLPQVCYDTYETCIFKAIFSVAYFGLFRISELVASSANMLGHPIEHTDVSIRDDKYAVIRLRHFKTNQRGNAVLLKIPRETGPICPVVQLSNFLTVRPTVSGLFFCHANQSPVTRSQVSAVLNKCIIKLGFTGMYRSHSFRIGRATDLAAGGCNAQTVMKLGRWSSDSYRLYIRN